MWVANAELVRSSGGIFEVAVNGQLNLSKKALGRFRTNQEVGAMKGVRGDLQPTSRSHFACRVAMTV